MICELWSVSSKLDIPEITPDVRKTCGIGWGRTQVCPSKGQAMPWCLVTVLWCPLGAAADQRCAGWQVGVWRRGECVGGPGALRQVTRVVEVEETTISSPAGRGHLLFCFLVFVFFS